MPKILIIKPSSLGDIVHTFPSAAMLSAAIPDLELDWVANDTLSQIVSLCPGIRRVIPFPRKAVSRIDFRTIAAFIRRLREESYDAVIDYQGLLRSGIMSYLTKTPLRIGFANAREGAPIFYTHKIALPEALGHAADKNRHLTLSALEILGISFQREALLTMEAQLTPPAEWIAKADAIASAHHWVAGTPLLAVGCSSRWASKSWPTGYFAEVLRHLLSMRPDLRMWLLGSKEEFSRAQQLWDLCGNNPAIVNLTGTTDLGALSALLSRSECLLTNDSGPMHIAAAFRIPCVAFFGATDPVKTGPYGPAGRHHIIRSLCPQSPCFKRICPRDATCNLCQEGIDAQKIAEEISAICQRP